jgi:hypothetical protein
MVLPFALPVFVGLEAEVGCMNAGRWIVLAICADMADMKKKQQMARYRHLMVVLVKGLTDDQLIVTVEELDKRTDEANETVGQGTAGKLARVNAHKSLAFLDQQR